MNPRFKAAITATVLAALAIHSYDAAAQEDGRPSLLRSTFINPDEDCQIEPTVTLTVPATNHDLNPRLNMNAPRLMQPVTGDFTIQVKVTGDFQPGGASTGMGRPFNGAGLLIWQDRDNFLRLERNAYWVDETLACYPPLLEYWRGGAYQPVNSDPTRADEFYEGDSTWLKLERQGDRMTASYSHDGEEWTVARDFETEFDEKVSVGVSAINTSDTEFSVNFAAFELTVESE